MAGVMTCAVIRYALVVALGAIAAGCNGSKRTRVVEVVGPSPAPVVSVVTVSVPQGPVDPASSVVPSVPSGHWGSTPHGHGVWIPDWLEIPARANMYAGVLDEIDRVMPERQDSIQQSAIPASWVGLPDSSLLAGHKPDVIDRARDWKVVLMWPGSFPTPSSPTLLAFGLTDFSRRYCYVAFHSSGQPNQNGYYMPVLPHEDAHALVWVFTGDVTLAGKAGH